MRTLDRKTAGLVIAALIILSGCAPVISKATLGETDSTLTFEKLLKDPSSHAGTVVVLGGRVIKVTNLKGISILEVLQSPLNKRLQPMADIRSRGRFLVEFRAFLDPVVYRGRLITVAGRVRGVDKGMIGAVSYRYPVLVHMEHHLWSPGEITTPRIGIGVGIGIHSY